MICHVLVTFGCINEANITHISIWRTAAFASDIMCAIARPLNNGPCGVRFLQGYVLQDFVDSGYGYESLTELPEVSGTGLEVLQNFQKLRVLWHGRTGLTEVPGGYERCCTRTPGVVARGVHNSQKFRVRV